MTGKESERVNAEQGRGFFSAGSGSPLWVENRQYPTVRNGSHRARDILFVRPIGCHPEGRPRVATRTDFLSHRIWPEADVHL